LAETQRSLYYAEPAAWKNAVLAQFPLPSNVMSGTRNDVLELFTWVRRHTKPGEAFLTRMGMGPTLLTYTDRPVVLQSKMENREIWPRLRGYLDSLYGPEDKFFAYCRRFGVKYVLYEADLALDASGDSERYSGNALKLRRDSTAYLCQFQPERMPHFRLVYQNSFYRVFEVLPEGVSAPPPALADVPLYDLRAYGEQPGDAFQDQGTPPVLARTAEARIRFDAAKRLLLDHRPEEALLEARKALELNSGMEGLRVTLALALTLMHQSSEVVPMLNDEVRWFPESVPARYYLGLFLVKSGRLQEGLAQWEEGLLREPENRAILAARSRYIHRR